MKIAYLLTTALTCLTGCNSSSQESVGSCARVIDYLLNESVTYDVSNTNIFDGKYLLLKKNDKQFDVTWLSENGETVEYEYSLNENYCSGYAAAEENNVMINGFINQPNYLWLSVANFFNGITLSGELTVDIAPMLDNSTCKSVVNPKPWSNSMKVCEGELDVDGVNFVHTMELIENETSSPGIQDVKVKVNDEVILQITLSEWNRL